MKKKTILENKKKYDEILRESLSIKIKSLNELNSTDNKDWDSIGHMTIISNLEKKFQISFKSNDIIKFTSYKKGLKILRRHKIKI